MTAARPLSSDAFRPQEIAARSCLVLGGARSGKSRYAQELAERSGRGLVYVATASVWDEEMRRRVDHHRAARDGRWRTVEETLALPDVLQRETADGTTVLVDCLTLWLTNVMLGGRDVATATTDLADAVAASTGPVVLVSNEVGAGIVPDNALARDFRDAQGWLNQAMARCCEAVVLVTAGLPTLLKPSLAPSLVLSAGLALSVPG